MSACIEHTQQGDKDGYGHTHYQGKRASLHRLAHYKATGTWPEVVRHTCDNPRCINPEHLLGGSASDNVQDMLSRGRGNKAAGEDSGRCKLSDEQVLTICNSNLTVKQLALTYSVTKSCIYYLKSGKGRT